MIEFDKMSDKEKFIAVITARMDSTRLPGKVMADIVGKPLIWHMVKRLQHVSTISNVVIAATKNEYDRKLRDFAESENIPYYSGSETDIADRLFQSGKMFNATVLVHINGDCPLIDPYLVEQAIMKYYTTNPKPDMVTNSVKRTFPEGLQYSILKFQTIENIWHSLKDAFWREYVRMYIIEKRDLYSVISIENETNLSSLRWTVDYNEDLDLVRQIYQNLYKKNNFFGMVDILSLLERKPELQKINSKYSSEIGLNSYEELREEHKSGLE